MNKLPITVIIHTKNAQDTLGQALESVVHWAQEIIVADMESTDKTREIAKQYLAQVILVKDVGFADPVRNEVVAHATNDWILVVDADETVPTGLANSLETYMNKTVDVWMVPRKNIILGKWIKHTGWWPDYQAHLFKKGKVTWLPEVHRQPEKKGVIDYIPAEEELAKIHQNYQTIEAYISRMNIYTSLELKGLRGKTTDDPISAWGNDFLRRYYQNKGYLDQTHGLYLAFLQGFYEAVRELKMWQDQGFPENKSAGLSLQKFIRDLKYWEADRKLARSAGLGKLWWQARRKLKI